MDTINTLRDMEKKIFFVTNNSTKSRKGCLDKFTSLGLKVYEEGDFLNHFPIFLNSVSFLTPLLSNSRYRIEIFSSSFAAAAYLEQNPMPQGKKVYVIGQHGICEELNLLGISHIGGPADADNIIDFVHHSKINQDKDVGAVIVGLDTSINYYKIQYAQLCINENEGCLFIATNLDAVAHLTDQQKWAGGGAMVGAIRGCTGRKPILVGKPSPLLIDYITGKHKIDRSRICMVGDRLDTDIVFGRDNGLQTVLTLSGVTTEDQVLSAENEIIPDFFVASIADLLQ